MDNKSIAPHLVMRDSFVKILADYRMSERAKNILMKTPLVLLNGPSGTGRNTLIYELVRRGTYHFIVSDTTRPPRVNNGIPEQNGHEYWFRSEQEILSDLQKGEFLEAELIHDQQVSGTSIRELERAVADGKTPINEVEIGGLQTLFKAKPDTFAIILLPPSFEEWQRRLNGRGKITDQELKNRLNTAVRVLSVAIDNPHILLLVHETVEQAADQIEAWVQGSPVDAAQQAQARSLAARLLQQTQARIAELES